MRHTLTSVLGGESRTIQMEIRHVRLLDGDRLLLCSDGLTDMVNEQEIAEVIAASEGSSDVCDRLMNLALEKGGKDNVTVLLARYSIPNPLS
ncbi:SpoIIE family protein phosphatase [bacterium]|nr:SpoIIE family protein phosphatase [bacterium]